MNEIAETEFTDACAALDKGDCERAFELMKAASEAGNLSAMANMGVFYLDGVGTPPNTTLGLLWSRRAALKRNSTAATNVALYYLDLGNSRRASYWFNRAVSLGDQGAMFYLAKMLIARNTARSQIRAVEILRDLVGTRWLSEEESDEARLLISAHPAELAGFPSK